MNIAEDQVIALARQLRPEAKQALALALLRDQEDFPTLADLRQRSRPGLATLLCARGLDIEQMTPEELD